VFEQVLVAEGYWEGGYRQETHYVSDAEFELEADILDGPSLVQTVSYAYDANNLRIRKTVDADGVGSGAAVDTFFSWQGNQIALQFSGGSLTHRYLYGPVVDQLLADETVTSLSSAGSIVWPLSDHLGTVADLAAHNSSTHATTVANHRTFDSYGNITAETNTAVDILFGFTGRERDDETGLQYNRARFYDAWAGRWISQDPIGFLAGDTNLFRYVSNRTVQLTDPSGEIVPILIGIGAVVIILAGTTGGNLNAPGPGDPTYPPGNPNWWGVGAGCLIAAAPAIIGMFSTGGGGGAAQTITVETAEGETIVIELGEGVEIVPPPWEQPPLQFPPGGGPPIDGPPWPPPFIP
jgi:RHS repeat-associated protein